MKYQNEDTDNQLQQMDSHNVGRDYGNSNNKSNIQWRKKCITKALLFFGLGVVIWILIGPFFHEQPQYDEKPIQFTTIENEIYHPGGKSLFNRIYKVKANIKQVPEKEQDKPAENKLKNEQESQKYVTKNVKKLLKQGRYFDIHYFVEDHHNYDKPRVINRAKLSVEQDINEKRPLLITTKSLQELQIIVAQMNQAQKLSHGLRIKLDGKLSEEMKRQLNFVFQLSLYPEHRDYLEAEYYYYDTNYHIGNYGRQLPLCLALVGKNNANVILKMYESIRHQNYTNYRIAHVDDGSDDGTYQKVTEYLQKHKFMKQRTTFIMQPYQRNALYNRHYANTNVCQDGDIIIDLDTDDYLIGRQVFQLVNTLYQSGYNYNGNNQQVWTLFLNFIYSKHDLVSPISPIHGQVRPLIIEQQVYRISDEWRTTHLRTYLWKLYQKINATDFVDQANIKQGQFYGEAPDLFMMDAIFQMSAPKHIKIRDQFVYFYTGSGQRDQLYPEYCSVSGRSLPIYNALQNLDSPPTRGQRKMTLMHKQISINKVRQKLKLLKQKVLQTYKKEKESVKQQRKN